MAADIRELGASDVDEIVRLSLAAWEPVFESFQHVLGEAIYTRIYPEWRTSQAAGVVQVCRDARNVVWVAEVDGAVAGFIAVEMKREKQLGVVQLLAVEPQYQNRGLGTELNVFALERMKEAGMTLAEVATGGDPGHAPARRSYEKAGYTGLPLVRYYKKL